MMHFYPRHAPALFRRTSGGLPRRRSLPLVLAAILLCCTVVLNVPGGAHAMDRAASHATATSGGLYYGFAYPNTPDPAGLSAVESQIGKSVSLVLWYQAWESEGVPQPFPADQMQSVRDHGAIPVLAWEPDNYPQGATDPAFSLSKIIGGAYDAYLRQYAAAARAWGHPFFLRFAAEMNGYWTLWSDGTNGNSKGQYVAAWKHVHDIFAAAGATNVSWMWCPNRENASTIPLEQLYPGAAYVDWACIDGYNFAQSLGPWLTFSQLFHDTYAHLLRMLPPTMPIMIGETGSVEAGGSKSAWITDALTQLPTQYPRIKGLIWFDIAKGDYDLRIDTSAQSLAAFRAAIASSVYLTNQYSSLAQSPIPSPEQFNAPTPTPTSTPVPTPVPQSPSSVPITQGWLPFFAGTIQLIDTQKNRPIAHATLAFRGGIATATDAQGVAHLPSTSAQLVLQRIDFGNTHIPTQFALDNGTAYQLQIDGATGKIARIVTFYPLLWLVLLVIALAVLGLVVAGGVALGRRRRALARTKA